ncbi:MAG: diguanylate cyclase [Coleofasciculaceae cyanobacterium RL_1_1]|nr:diguanylate cyclase [Coleofasciculaceae cyanobacterium RL_1_1]
MSTLIVGVIDWLTGSEISFSLFYLVPVTVVTWFLGKIPGIVTSVIAAIVWMICDYLSGNSYSYVMIYYWNSFIRFGFFLIVTLLFSSLQEAMENERRLARIDGLTGALNSRSFSELLQTEFDRFKRRGSPFTLAYVDLDNFKMVNDSLGHTAGDHVLNLIVTYAQAQLRKTDYVARLGGDEFALLLTETDQRGAEVAISKIQFGLLEEMKRNHWPITFSIGVLTCVELPDSIDDLIKQADNLMYLVKHSGKNSARYALCCKKVS